MSRVLRFLGEEEDEELGSGGGFFFAAADMRTWKALGAEEDILLLGFREEERGLGFWNDCRLEKERRENVVGLTTSPEISVKRRG